MISNGGSAFIPSNHGELVWNPLSVCALPVSDMILVAFVMLDDYGSDDEQIIVTTAFTTGGGEIDYDVLDFERDEVDPLAWMPLPEPFSIRVSTNLNPSRN